MAATHFSTSSTMGNLDTTAMKLMFCAHMFRMLHVTRMISESFGYFTRMSTSIVTAPRSNSAWHTGSYAHSFAIAVSAGSSTAGLSRKFVRLCTM